MLVARQGRGHRAGRATYTRDVSVTLLLSASESAAAPASPILLCSRLQRGEEGSGMLVTRQGRRHKEGRARLTRATSASSVHSQAYRYSSPS
jgi:hypothetical protein